ncbi:ribonuclease Z [Paraburkholderia podalyriae]|uniref:MBL fold metallo-hydrolase n=1 Tax=Paraburkholderia podalyriae TaxID=1938811 RepID=A0ABR7Q359_9BURK|nr:MBL fold metallo-hydrolase [Paraburkholderia podalyriae]MBC8752932.1 MBL fold metallo-hydrolase [Paraburkholderia podalyriae]
MHALFEPWLVNDAFGDPGVYVDFRDERRGLLFDLGDIARLLPRQLMRISHVFVTHTHMDHFSGFDHLLRVTLGRKAGIVMFGGPNFLAQIEHKLSAYTWNVVHRYEVELVIDAREIGVDGGGQRALFSSRRRFAPETVPSFDRSGDVVYDEATFRVRGRFVDHGIPCVAYVLEEKARVNVAKDRLAALGVSTGGWLRELKHAVLTGAPDEAIIDMRWRDRRGEHAMTRQVGELRHLILDIVPGQRIGYVTDLRYTEPNIETLSQLMHDVDLLFIESVFLDEDKAHGLRKNHLTARQADLIARRIGARAVVPFHFSPRYEGRSAALIAEVQAAWSATSALVGERPG